MFIFCINYCNCINTRVFIDFSEFSSSLGIIQTYFQLTIKPTKKRNNNTDFRIEQTAAIDF